MFNLIKHRRELLRLLYALLFRLVCTTWPFDSPAFRCLSSYSVAFFEFKLNLLFNTQCQNVVIPLSILRRDNSYQLILTTLIHLCSILPLSQNSDFPSVA